MSDGGYTGAAFVAAAQKSLFQQHMVRYVTQTPPILGSVNPDEIERLAAEKLNSGTLSINMTPSPPPRVLSQSMLIRGWWHGRLC